MQSLRNTWKNKPIVIILGGVLVFLVFLLVILLIVRAVTSGNNVGQGDGTPAANTTVTATSDVLGGGDPDTDPDPTATNTPVLSGATSTPTPSDDDSDSGDSDATPTPTVVSGSSGSTTNGTPTPTPTAILIAGSYQTEAVQNGGFERFSDDGVAENWTSFNNQSANFIFAAEQWPPAIYEGEAAQRITIVGASQPNRYAGIYQTLSVIPGSTYSLTLHGQIRSPFGNITESDYGYRMQYALDLAGGTDWQAVLEDDWVELPWDEQLIDGTVNYLSYAQAVTAESDEMTLFIRAWNKWPDGLEGQYTLDSVSVIGSQAAEAMIDQPLPTTGTPTDTSLALWLDPRFWVSLMLLALLLGGAAWQYRRTRYTGHRVD